MIPVPGTVVETYCPAFVLQASISPMEMYRYVAVTREKRGKRSKIITSMLNVINDLYESKS